MTKYALTVGINQYPSSPLQGCVADATDWRDALEARGFETTTILDADATRDNVLRWLVGMLEACGRDDLALFHFSGHGTRVPDRDGDEVDGWDEAIVPHDYATAGMVLDDDLYTLFSDADRRGVRVVFISDSCHSGTMQRLAPALTGESMHPLGSDIGSPTVDAAYRRARWLSPAEWMDVADIQKASASWTAPRGVSRRSALVLAACRPDQVAYDAYIGGRYRGAFTAAALTALASYPTSGLDGVTFNYRDWQRRIRTRLPSVDFDQVPSLDGTAAQRRWLLFQEQGRR